MKENRGFTLHPGAASDITAIWDYIAKDNPASARKVREKILGAIRTLVLFPNQGHQRTDLSSGTLRFQTVGSYLIAYAPEEEPMVVIAVLHGRRNPRVMASILRGRK